MLAMQKHDFTKRTKRRGNEAKIYTKWRHVEGKVAQTPRTTGAKTQAGESLALGGGGEREVKIRLNTIQRIGRADKEN